MMHKVMLIDDDVPMLKVLQQMIDWESLKLHVVGSTYSSAKALLMFEETSPDIVITDIGLPKKSGIELAMIFREMKPDIRVIFLTCHEDFHYAQQAVQLNADDYLLKDKLTAEQLEQSLRKSIGLLSRISTKMDKEVSSYNSELFKQGLIQRVIDGVHPGSTVEYAARLGISWEYACFMMGTVNIHYSTYEQRYVQSNLPLISYAIYNISMELSASYQGITSFIEHEKLVILYNYRDNLADNAYLHFQKYLQELRNHCSHFLKLQLSTVTVTDKMGLQSIGTFYHQIVQYKNEFYESNELAVTDVQLFLKNMFLPSPQGLLDPYKSDIERAILKNDTESICNIVSAMGRNAQGKRIEPSELVQDLLTLLRSIDIMFSKWKSDEAIYSYLPYARTLEDVMELVVSKFVHIAQYHQKGTRQVVQEPKLQIIQHYIDKHLSENITSIDMARYLFLNSSYFSRYFKRLSGINFTDYVHQYKMEIATKMLKTSNQTFESLAMGLGYSDRTYFSKVFKKYIGMTPSEYKTKHSINRYINK
ncbi:response regulator transcription factor [Paenibacillus sp. FA6]|uniref:response regulator transcription factor n=1 Tax=Paenibacillus sp. FA6 TaxID=3413029 RepID=UPI003F6588EB